MLFQSWAVPRARRLIAPRIYKLTSSFGALSVFTNNRTLIHLGASFGTLISCVLNKAIFCHPSFVLAATAGNSAFRSGVVEKIAAATDRILSSTTP